MPLLFFVLLCFTAVVSLGIGALVLLRDYRKPDNLAFFGIALGVALWSAGIAGFIHTETSEPALVWAKIYYLAPLLIVVASAYYAYTFVKKGRTSQFFNRLMVLASLVQAILLVASPGYLTAGIRILDSGNTVDLDSTQYAIYGLFLMAGFIYSIVLMLRAIRTSKHALARQQARIYAAGFITSSILGVFFNLILPGLGNYDLIVVGPLMTAFWLFSTGYAIIKHRLFDIRLVIARSAGYLASLLTLAVIYGFIVFGIAQYVFGLSIPIVAQMALSFATGCAALMFQRMKKVFDKGTNRIFYRDAYDAQGLFNELNRILVSTLNLDKLLGQACRTLTFYLKASTCRIGLTNGASMRLYGDAHDHIDEEVLGEIDRLTAHIHRTVIVADYLESKHERLRNLMHAYDVAIIVQLLPNVRHIQDGLGYIMLGEKKSGNVYGQQDIEVLETVSNELIIAIQNALHFEEIQNFNTTLQEKIMHATKQLRNTNQRLKALDETKDDFISMASHQLRTPLTSVKGYLSMVVEGDAGDITPLQKQMLTQAYTSSQRMVYLISDLLNVSRLKTGKFVITPTKVSLADMVEEEVAQLKDTAAGRGIGLIFDKPAEWPMTYLDDTKVRQVVMNFMDNAIYYSRPGGTVTIKLDETPEAIELKIKDDGIGVPKAEQRHLFTKFYRANNARQIRPDGTGLGLFMAKKVIVAQGGTLLFRSTEGKGSTFGFSFAKKTIAAPADDSGITPGPIAVN